MAGEITEIKKILNDIKVQLGEKATKTQIDQLLAEIKAKDDKINSLENRMAVQDNRIEALEAKIEVQGRVNSLLERKIDDGEQYLRRMNLRITGLCGDPNVRETGEACRKKVISEVGILKVDIHDSNFDRAHRLGPEKKDKDGKPLIRPMIVRLTSWRDRTTIYRARNKDKEAKVKFHVDLTKRRFELKKLAIKRCDSIPDIDFVFADINCNLGMRFIDGSFKFFNSVEELDNILG